MRMHSSRWLCESTLQKRKASSKRFHFYEIKKILCTTLYTNTNWDPFLGTQGFRWLVLGLPMWCLYDCFSFWEWLVRGFSLKSICQNPGRHGCWLFRSIYYNLSTKMSSKETLRIISSLVSAVSLKAIELTALNTSTRWYECVSSVRPNNGMLFIAHALRSASMGNFSVVDSSTHQVFPENRWELLLVWA